MAVETQLALGIAVIAAVLGALVGVYGERFIHDRRERKLQRRYHLDESTSGGWQNAIYDIRDWANDLPDVIEEGASLATLQRNHRNPGEETLRYILMTQQTPQFIRPELLLLLEYTKLLNRALTIYLTRTDQERLDSGTTRTRLLELSTAVNVLAQKLAHPELQDG